MPENDSPHRGWYTRGYIPHFDSACVIQCVTYRLADCLPANALGRIKQELALLPPDRRDAVERARIDALSDAGRGSCVLRRSEAAELVQNAFLFHHQERYRLISWVVMPNHIHIMFEPFEGWSLSRIVGTWRSYTGRRLAPMMPTAQIRADGSRRVWQRGYWDRYVRDQAHYDRAIYYIDQNPVRAGLVARAEDWLWCSAGYRRRQEAR